MTSNADQDSESASVLDILYADVNRISTFISQFNEFGNLTSIVHSKKAGRSKSDESSANASGNVLLAKATGSIKHGYTAGHEESSQKAFDPRWINTLAFLDEIEARGLLKRDIAQAKLGQLVMQKGAMRIRDLSLMGKVWSLPSIKAFTKGQQLAPQMSRQERRATGQKQVSATAKSAPSEIDLIFELISVLPHSIQAQFFSTHKTWCLLNETSLNVSGSDFVLKSGGAISGEWGVIGILDAVPDTVELMNGVVPTPPLGEISDVMLRHIAPIARQFLGRPEDFYGVTPLVIFRAVGG